MQWISENAEWFFSGVGAVILSGIVFIIRRLFSNLNNGQSQKAIGGSTAIQAGRDVKINKK